MPQAMPSTSEETPQTCDSPSGSSTSEPHDDSMHVQQPFIDQSFFHKLDQLSPDNPLYFMQQQLLQQQQQQQRQTGETSLEEEDQSMGEASAEAESQTSALSPQSVPGPSSPQPATFSSTVTQSSCSGNVIEPLQPSNVSAPGSNQTFWSGVNNFFANVTHNPFPQAIPNLARNFTDYLSSNYPVRFPTSFNTPQQAAALSAPGTAPTPTVSAAVTPSIVSPNIQFELENKSSKSSGMQIRVLGVPQSGAKSRVETQIKLCIQLVTDDGDKAQWWSHLKLPEHMVAKDKLKRQVLLANAANCSKVAGLDSNDLPLQPEKMLFLSARVICASDPTRKVVTCLGCIQRERKRSQRRKENRIKAETEEEKRAADDEKSLALEEQKVLLFNCSEVVDFSSGDTILPTRITCYCRHHNERVGFCIYFEMHDHTGKRVATGISPPIMITDDHKSNKVKAGRKRPRTEADPANAQAMMAATAYQPFSAAQRQNGADPLNFMQYPLNALNNPQLTIQPRPTAQSPGKSRQMENMNSGATLPINVSDTSLASPGVAQLQISHDMLGNLAAMNNMGGVTTPTPTQSSTNADRPQLQRLIPNEGPTFGGIEVTILGTNFRPGLTCMFGETPASNTHFWSANTLVCILPAVAEPGPVVVSFKEYPVVMDTQEVMLFTYYNENDRALMELALQVVGLKMTGKVEDAREIAMRIVQGGDQGRSSGATSGQQSTGQQQQQQQQHQRQASLERHIIQVLEVMDTMEDVQPEDVSIANAQGHTMLHLAAMLGFNKLTLALLDLGCLVDVQDRNGSTALHYAAWFGHEQVVRTLLDEGSANPTIANFANKRAMHLAKDGTIRSLLLTYLPLEDRDTSESSHHGDVLSDAMSADIDTSFDEGAGTDYDDDDDSVWLGGSDVEERKVSASWNRSYLSDSSYSSTNSSVEFEQSGLRQRRRPATRQQFESIQYLELENAESNSGGEIPDAQAVNDQDLAISSDEDIPPTESKTWMQRTLSHFQQPKHQQSPSNDTSFLQNLKNNIPTKPADLNLKAIADHLLQLPRPTTMIHNMSVLFTGDQNGHRSSSTDEPEQALAWYMALAYAMGARSNQQQQQQEESTQRPNRKQHHLHAYTAATAGPSSSVASSSYDSFQTPALVTSVVKKQNDRRLFAFWVPMLVVMVVCLIYQFLYSNTYRNILKLIYAA